jgi:serine/threonine protein kinase
MADIPDRLKGALAGRYELDRELGEGGMARVFLAHDARHDRDVAVKVLKPDVAAAVGAQRFLTEIRTTANLQHPHVLPLFDSGEAAGFLYFVMPYVEGDTLRTRLDRDGPLSLPEALRFARELAEALDYAHSQGVIHRDVKPANVLLSGGHVLLADFGVAQAVSSSGDTRLTQSGMLVGTPEYVSPEQASGEPDLDARADVYALACVLHEMLSGKPPFPGDTPLAVVVAHMNEPRPSLQSLGVSVPAAVERAIATAMNKDRTERFQSIAEFAAALSGASPFWDSRSPIAVELDRVPNAGILVAKLCNRWRQVNAFDSAVRRTLRERPGRPQLFVLYGEEGNGHGSLLDRLFYTRIQDLARAIADPNPPVVTRAVVPWPRGQAVGLMERDLEINLFRELEPSYMNDDLTIGGLAGLESLRPAHVTVVEHDVRAHNWNRASAQLLRWYVHDFWGAFPREAEGPLFLIFLKVIWDTSRQRALWPLSIAKSRARRRLVTDLHEITADATGECSAEILDELTPVTVEDVKDWFAKNRIYHSEEKRNRLAESLFRRAAGRPIAAVEEALEEFHEDFLKEQMAKGVRP